MPQLVKGGKHVFGWASVTEGGRIMIPLEALEEYGFQELETLVLMPGSRTSAGFSLGSEESLRKSSLGAVVDFGDSRVPDGTVIERRGKTYSLVQLKNGGVTVLPETLKKYSIGIRDMLLVIRGSGLALGFAANGPIFEEAKRHPELEVF